MLFRHFILREKFWFRSSSFNPGCMFLCSNTWKIFASTHVLKVVQLGSSFLLLVPLYCSHTFLPPLNTSSSSRCSADNSPARSREDVAWCFTCSCTVKWLEISLFLPSFCHLCPPTIPFVPRSTPTFYTYSGINVLGADEAEPLISLNNNSSSLHTQLNTGF